MHPGQSYASDFGQTYAHRAMLCPRFGTDHFGIVVICLRFQADLCTPCINMPQIWDRFLHTGQCYAPDIRLTSPLLERDDTKLTHTIGKQK